MKVLLDTNIIINRENPHKPVESVNRLFSALDKLKFEKCIHPATIEEIKQYKNEKERDILLAKLHSYELIKSRPNLSFDFMEKLKEFDDGSQNSKNDNELLYQIYDGRIDFLITEDKVMHQKAQKLNIANKVFSIEQFLTYYKTQYPDLVDYKMLSIKKTKFGNLNLNDPFFDSLREDYAGFDQWFKKKHNEDAYVFIDKKYGLSAFLYIKTEHENENYAHIEPVFPAKKRLKVGTFKAVSSGFRIGERFLKIVFDNALERHVDEIYVTLYDKPALAKLKEMFANWGFYEYGINKQTGELVMVKEMKYNHQITSPQKNFPFFNEDAVVRFLPIWPEFHTKLFPDSILRTEDVEDYDNKEAYEYAIKKAYISFSFKYRDLRPGDVILIYRTGGSYKGVVTTICILNEVVKPTSLDELLNLCENRSVFKKEELIKFWNDHNKNLTVVKLLYLKSLPKKVIVNDLWNLGIVDQFQGPRSFDIISKENYLKILNLSNKE